MSGKSNAHIENFAEGDLKSLRDLSRHPFVIPNLVYGTENNFVGANIYNSFQTPLAHYITDEKLIRANNALQKIKAGWKFIIYDALRPHRFQEVLWKKVEGTPQEPYVMNPKYGSIHSYGFALDLSLVDEKGQEIDMGTPVDTLDPLSEPRLEDHFLKLEKLKAHHIENRKLLRHAMSEGGFRSIANEWWHFEALPASEVRSKYPIYK
jgi:D-alanyl-D-alanine dipeptidase